MRSSTLRTALATLICLLLSSFMALGAQADDMTLDQLIAKNAEARGGEAAFDAVKSAKVSAKMNMGGMEAPMTLYIKEPGKMRMDVEIQGATITQAWDGEAGWQVMPLMGVTDPQEMSEEEAKQMKRQDFIRGLLLTFKDKGYAGEYMGIDEIEGTQAHKVKITLEEGDVVYSYVDTDYFLEFMEVAESTDPQTGQSATLNISYGDFKPVGDLLMPFSVEIKPEGAPAGSAITIDTIELNTDDVTDDLFEMPEVAATDEAAADNAGGES